MLVGAAVALGAVRGACTLLQATAVADRWGTSRYGTLSGFFAAPITAATALAPWAGTALAEAVGGYPAAAGVFAALVLTAVGLAWWARGGGQERTTGSIRSSASRPRTRRSISSRMGRTASTPLPAGSSSVQSK